MKQRNSKISSYNIIRNNLYANVERHDLTERKTFGIIAICALLLAAALLFTAAMIEISSRVKYTYIFGDTEQVLDDDIALIENVIYIDMNALADYCNMDANASTFTSNGTSVTFENGSDTATVNGLALQLTSEAIITNDLCLIPLADAESMIHGIKATVSGTSIQINMSSQIYIINRKPSVSYLTDVSKYLEYINSSDAYIKTLTNKQNKIDRYFQPSDLVEIPAEYRRSDRVLKLSLTAEKAIEAMMNDMRAMGFDDVCVQSAYRTYAEQESLFNNYVNSEMNKGLSYEKALENANKYSAKPEYSEHRTGLCVDFFVPSLMLELENYGHEGNYPNDVGFTETDVYPWLIKNCWKYGFILRYPEDKIDITGYSYESWHYRFVGIEVASIIHQTGLSYEEYLEIFN